MTKIKLEKGYLQAGPPELAFRLPFWKCMEKLRYLEYQESFLDFFSRIRLNCHF